MFCLSKLMRGSCALLLAAALLVGCTAEGVQTPASQAPKPTAKTAALAYQVDPASFVLTLQAGGSRIAASAPMQERKVTDLKEANGTTEWVYPGEQISVRIAPVEDYLQVAITSHATGDASFAWPQIAAEQYYLPLGEGKRVPAADPTWGDYLGGQEFSVMEQLSMPFWASSVGDYAVVYILEDPYRSELNFSKGESIAFHLSHAFPQLAKSRTKRLRVYLTEDNPVAVAKAYRNYVAEQGKLITLEQKAQSVPEISKLYGAPFIYLWGSFVVSPDDIQWNTFRQSLDSPIMRYLLTFADGQENGTEFRNILNQIRGQNYVAAYQKNVICRYISEVIAGEDFWNAQLFTAITPAMNTLLSKDVANLSSTEKIQLGKQALAANMSGVFKDASTWMNNDTVDLFGDMKASGLQNAWIGLHGWEQAFAKPELVEAAAAQGYLIASYDSYHSIHEPGKEQWETARFEDKTLYEQATVSNASGKKISGFQNVGRKLNPVLAMPSVKQRMQSIVETNKLRFNSWFVDCDATGEIYDDYTPTHVTTQEEDLAARMQRMAYISDTYKMVVGSEGGNDFAAPTIAFAHGIELKSFSWMDADMKTNKDSDYYIGKYYSPSGGVAEHFAKRVPLKDKYYTLFVDPSFDLPLFKLVYNDSVITSYHWEWSTFKIKDATQSRMLREVLYNVPPLYHLDAAEWAEYKDDIVRHTAVWSSFSRQATKREMTDFAYLTADGLVQRTRYGNDMSVVANFGTAPYSYEGKEIPAGSALMVQDGKTMVYTPTVSQAHR